MNRAAAFAVVADFEQALCEYTGAPFCVTTDSCTNALYLALKWCQKEAAWFYEQNAGTLRVHVPKHTYVGVVQAVKNAGFFPMFTDEEWEGSYRIPPLPIIDSAKFFRRDMYEAGTLTCLSFQAGKILPIGRGGAILHDNPEADEWLRRARLDGRTAGADYADNTYQREGWHCYMLPEHAARGLHLLTYIDDDDPCDWTAYPDLSEATWT